MKVKNSIQKWSPLVLMILIFVESSIPMDGGPDNIAFLTTLDPGIQNLLHIPLYGTLAVLWLRFFCGSGTLTRQMVVYSLVITICYGCLDEVHQSFVRGRYGGLLDVYLNIFGAVAGTIFFGYLKKRKALKNI
ncbi:VanZ family protein [Desulfobacula sp.]|uniref:VanZ family protein n=1 Tax=Desulfobacula sp. TaxID=2593537 RepID=UPI002608C765|nr:VanZ family protein [Desulfobacula sp.]